MSTSDTAWCLEQVLHGPWPVFARLGLSRAPDAPSHDCPHDIVQQCTDRPGATTRSGSPPVSEAAGGTGLPARLRTGASGAGLPRSFSEAGPSRSSPEAGPSARRSTTPAEARLSQTLARFQSLRDIARQLYSEARKSMSR